MSKEDNARLMHKPKKKFTKTDVAREYVARFPRAKKQALARLLMRDVPQLFPTFDSADTAVRRATGSAGELMREQCGMDTYRALTDDTAGFPKLPDGITNFKDWAPFEIPGESHTLVLPDMHVPYHDKEAVEIAIGYGLECPDLTHVLLNGDLIDFFSVSFWQKDPRLRDLKNEIETARTVIQHIRAVFPKAKIILKVGNHEERWERYLAVKAPELLGVDDFELFSVLRLAEQDVTLVSDMRPLKLGDLFVVHGHEFRWSIANPVNPARGFYLRAQDHCLGSHLHQSSSHSEKRLGGEVISCFSTGCLCDLHPDYAPINKWSRGFAFVDAYEDGTFQVTNKKIVDGKIYKG